MPDRPPTSVPSTIVRLEITCSPMNRSEPIDGAASGAALLSGTVEAGIVESGTVEALPVAPRPTTAPTSADDAAMMRTRDMKKPSLKRLGTSAASLVRLARRLRRGDAPANTGRTASGGSKRRDDTCPASRLVHNRATGAQEISRHALLQTLDPHATGLVVEINVQCCHPFIAAQPDRSRIGDELTSNGRLSRARQSAQHDQSAADSIRTIDLTHQNSMPAPAAIAGG